MQKLLVVFLIFFAQNIFAQISEKDSIWTEINDERIMVVHSVKANENLYSIAQLYAVPALVLSQTNDVAFYDKMELNKKLFVPLGRYNYATNKMANTKAIFYKTNSSDSYTSLSKIAGIEEVLLRKMNSNISFAALPKNVIQIGWVYYEGADKTLPKANTDIVSSAISSPTAELAPGAVVKKIDERKEPPSELEKIYNYQTTEGAYVDSINGMVAFFKPQTTINNDLLYCMSDEVPRGKVVKIVNPSNQNYVFAKVIGPLPKTKQYINATIGLDGRARKLLDTREVKLWCKFLFKY